MDYGKIIFFRNFFVRAFIIGVAFALFYFIATYAVLEHLASSWATHVFKTDEKELRKSGFDVFRRAARSFSYFFFLCQLWPCIGWPERCMTDQHADRRRWP